MSRRVLQSIAVLVLSVPAAAYFVLLPQWQIEHPNDASLILRNERHWLWQAPAHAHLNAASMAVPVIAIAIVVFALFVILRHTDY